jgi:hypothetical protein
MSLDGGFLGDGNDAVAIEGGLAFLKQNVVATVLKLSGYYVFVDTNRHEDDCNGITGARWINNVCLDSSFQSTTLTLHRPLGMLRPLPTHQFESPPRFGPQHHPRYLAYGL